MSEPIPVVEIVVLLADVDDTVEPFNVNVPVVLPTAVLYPAVLLSVNVAALIVFDVVDVTVVTGAVTVSVDAVIPTVPVELPIVVLFEPVALMFVVPSTVFVPVELPMFTLPDAVLMFVVAEATEATSAEEIVTSPVPFDVSATPLFAPPVTRTGVFAPPLAVMLRLLAFRLM
jgi:hypothetical protein